MYGFICKVNGIHSLVVKVNSFHIHGLLLPWPVHDITLPTIGGGYEYIMLSYSLSFPELVSKSRGLSSAAAYQVQMEVARLA